MHEQGEIAGQYRTVGATLMGMGSVFSVLATYLIISETSLDAAFIAPEGMLGFSLLFVAVGLWQWLSARRFQESQPEG